MFFQGLCVPGGDVALMSCKSILWMLQIEIMGAFFGVGLNLLRSGIRCYEASDPSIRNHLLKVFFYIIVTSCLSSHIKAALVRPVASIVTVISITPEFST